jgi:hypothetical protein
LKEFSTVLLGLEKSNRVLFLLRQTVVELGTKRMDAP